MAALLSLAATSHAAEPPPVEAFFAEPEYRLPKISPNGANLAVVVRRDFTDSIALLDAATMSARPAPAVSNLRVLNYWWKGDHILVFLVQQWSGKAVYYRFDLQTRKTLELRKLNLHGAIVVDGLVSDDRNLIITGSTNTGLDLQRYDCVADKLELVEKNPGWVLSWLPDSTGHAVAGFGRTEGQWFMVVRDQPGDKWRRIELGGRSLPDFWPISAAPDGRRLLGYDYATADTVRVVSRDPRTGTDELLVHRPDLDPTRNVFRGDDRVRLRGVIYDGAERQIEYLSPSDAQFGADLGRVLPGTLNLVVSTSKDEKRLLIRSTSATVSERYYLLDLTGGRLVRLGGTRADLPSGQQVPPRFCEFPSPDGLKLSARIFLPPGSSPHALVLDCGTSLSSPARHIYEPLQQLLASRGYAVMQVDHRGVDGHGRAFSRAGELAVQTAMTDDLAAGVRYAIAQGWADPHRIVILGTLEGGVLAMHTLARHPDLFTAWINFATPIAREPVESISLVLGARATLLGEFQSFDALPLEKYARTLDTEAILPSLKVRSFHHYAYSSLSYAKSIGRTLKKSGVPCVTDIGANPVDVDENVTAIDRRGHLNGVTAFKRALEFLAGNVPAGAASVASPSD